MKGLQRFGQNHTSLGLCNFSETGTTPFEFLFGSLDAKFLRLPNLHSKQVANKFIGELDRNLKGIREAAWEVISKMNKTRLREVPNQCNNQYQVGDFILVDDREMGRKKSKLAPRFSGPYIVDQTYKADLTIRHVVTGDVKVVHMEVVKPFFTLDFDEAYQAALSDQEQYDIERVLNFRGGILSSEWSFLFR
jgi:hypothetical protein